MEKGSTITAKQFKNLQSHSRIRSAELAKILGKSKSTIAAYRSGQLRVPSAIAEKMRELARRGRGRDARNKASIEGHVQQWLRAYSSQFTGEGCTFSAAPKYSQVDVTQDIDENLHLMTDTSMSWWTRPYYGD